MACLRDKQSDQTCVSQSGHNPDEQAMFSLVLALPLGAGWL